MTTNSQNTVDVAILPTKGTETNLVQRVSSIIGKDLFGTRLLLAGRVPKIVARHNTLEAAELAAQKLREIGLTTIVCKESELRSEPRVFGAHSLQIGEKEITFSGKSGQSMKMASDNAFLIIQGQVETGETTEVTTKKTKLNVPIPLLTGGIQVRRQVTEKTTETTAQTEHFLRVYDKNTSDSSVEMRQHDFDYSSALPKLASFLDVNFAGLVTRIRDACPLAVFDDRLRGNVGLCLPYITPWENVNILCKLVYLFTLSSTNPKS